MVSPETKKPEEEGASVGIAMLDILTNAFADEMHKIAATDTQVREKMSKLSPEAREHARRLLVRDSKKNPDAARRLKILNEGATNPRLSASTNAAMDRARRGAEDSAYANKGWKGLEAHGGKERATTPTSVAVAAPSRDAKWKQPATWFKTHRFNYQPARKWSPQGSIETTLGRWSKGRTS